MTPLKKTRMDNGCAFSFKESQLRQRGTFLLRPYSAVQLCALLLRSGTNLSARR
jgi:hypothetical protein